MISTTTSRTWTRYFAVAITIASFVPSARAAEEPSTTIEPWASKALEVTDGLVVWLDAAAQNAARKQHDEPELREGDALEIWRDGSGNRLDVRQKESESRPKLRLDGPLAFLQFDGIRTNLSHDKVNRSLGDLTIFIVAAPYSSEGSFPALLGMNAAGKDDYRSGLNIDLGPNMSSQFNVVNVEGAGFSGVRNLMTEPAEFCRWQRLCLTSSVGQKGTALEVNGEAAGSRDREDSTIGMDQLAVGARRYAGPSIRSFFAGEIAEVLVYDRKLTDDQRSAVDRYLADKFAEAKPVPAPSIVVGGKPLEQVENPPPVQMFVPGFVVKQLPVDLTNINNVLYREDGKLVALAYNGNVYLLTDTDGDGLEDKAEVFFENKGELRAPTGMALTPPGYKRGRGIFTPSKGKCSLIVDTDGDDVADEEIIVAEGWKEGPHGVDALGAAYDPRDGSIYFGLGCENFASAYVPSKDGKAQYRLDSERGTIMRVAPDFESRESVATGIRFPVGIRFNRNGDLFCTDQEGATWLANGNPFDELLNIDLEKTRHYGFPPRHPQHLPDVIDEPSVFDYGPQHQCTCGLNFNEPVNGGPTFGPAWWRHDAIVAGESRGKLFRTKLMKTAAGYVAQTQRLAALNMLTIDACVAPDGSLVICTHSGPPDWGTGPGGKGKLFKVIYADQQVPIPVLTWAQTPYEVRIVFDREIDPETLKGLVSKITIDRGEYVAAGDRFESLRPPYPVVQGQVRTPRFEHKLFGIQLMADRRTLILSTAQHSTAVGYSVTLPGLGRPTTSDSASHELPQHPETDLQYDLSGVETTWQPQADQPAENAPPTPNAPATWNGWLPHLNLAVARTFTQGSGFHDELWQRCRQPGTLTLRTQLQLRDMLRPAIQAGEKIDYEWPPEEVTLVFESNVDMDVKFDDKLVATQANTAKHQWTSRVVVPASATDALHPLEIRLRHESSDHESSDTAPQLTITYHTNEDARLRAMPLRRMLLPWASTAEKTDLVVDNRKLPELQGGNWLNGRKVYFGEQAGCSKCHKMRGEGGIIGPDLSNVTQRGYDSVLRDVTQPSVAINPDFISHTLQLHDGRVLTGSIRTEGGKLIVGDKDGRETTIGRDDIGAIHPSSLSIMPDGIPKLLGPDKLRDLLTFLLIEPPRMPVYGSSAPPPPRSLEEVKAVLAGSDPNMKTRPIHVVLVSGRKDHGLGEHDYPAWQTVWEQLMSMAPDTRVTTAKDWPSEDDLKSADVLVFFQQGKWTPERARDIDAFLARGGGLVYIHFAVDGGADAPGFAQRIGLAWRGGQSKFRHGPLDLDFAPGESHPIARNFTKVHFHDESYWNLIGDTKRPQLLATGVEENQPQPLFWTMEPGRGRVFVSIPGHFSWTFDDPLFRILLLRGIAWTANEPVDRFNDLATPGARITPAQE